MAVDASTHAHPSVFDTPIQLLALTITERLQNAGIPAVLSKHFGFHVLVPPAWLADARALLFPPAARPREFLHPAGD
jgi:hypothetical protein